MASRISNLDLLNKVRAFLLTNASDNSLNHLIELAIVQADRDLHNCDPMGPLAWDIASFDGYRTVRHAVISAITQADPGVFTAASIDSSITGHGFHDHSSYGAQDIVIADDIDGMEELNDRIYLLEYIDATTFSLKTLNGLDAIDTSGYSAYSSGGVVYHAGFLLTAATVLDSVNSKWTIKRLHNDPRFDGIKTDPISENEASHGWQDISQAQRPTRYRYWQNITDADTPTIGHNLLWYPVCDDTHNLKINYIKEIPDISTFDDSTYPFHPPQVHDALWHGALSILAGLSKRMERQNDKVIATQLEVMFANKWTGLWEIDKIRAVELSRYMLGDMGNSKGFWG